MAEAPPGRLPAAVGTLAFLLLAPGTVAGIVPWLITRWHVVPGTLLPLQILGGGLIAAGAALLLDSFARFALQGRGTPAPPFPTHTLVVTGLYRHVRNPMYVAVLGLVLGQAAGFGSWSLLRYAGFLWLAFHTFVLIYEEPTLRDRYGASYAAYCAGVRRWWPRLSPWRPGVE